MPADAIKSGFTATCADLTAILGETDTTKLLAEIESEPFDFDLAAWQMFELYGQECAEQCDRAASTASENGYEETAETWMAVAKHCRDAGYDRAKWKELSRELLAATARIAAECVAAGFDATSGEPPSPELQAKIDEIAKPFLQRPVTQ
jgi:hypothetical protein